MRPSYAGRRYRALDALFAGLLAAGAFLAGFFSGGDDEESATSLMASRHSIGSRWIWRLSFGMYINMRREAAGAMVPAVVRSCGPLQGV
jgi:hypothetical protein